MNRKNKIEFDVEIRRSRILFIIMAVVFALLLSWLWMLQVKGYGGFANASERHSVRKVRIAGLRGSIYDRHGYVVAGNRASHGIAVYLHEIRRNKTRKQSLTDAVDKIIDTISRECLMERQIGIPEIKKHILEKKALPLVIWEDITNEALARYTERIGHIPGVDVYNQSVRIYPHGDSACHIVGHVGYGGMGSTNETSYSYYMQDMEGKSGLESTLDPVLRGAGRPEVLQINVHGYAQSTLKKAENITPGLDLGLSLNMHMQRFSERIIGDDPGAICIIDPWNGDTLALASYPRYDLQSMVGADFQSYIASLNTVTNRPWINRCFREHYAPGSTFKPVVCLGALKESGNGFNINRGSTFYCQGHHKIGDTFKMHCGLRSGHGTIHMVQAIERSCNVYFYQMGLMTGYDVFRDMGLEFGFGKKTGIGSLTIDGTQMRGLPEARGFLPEKAWKLNHPVPRFRDRWRPPDTMNASIGQAPVLATPLQVAMMAGAIANGGTLYRPRLIRWVGNKDNPMEVPPEVVNEVNVDLEHIKTMQLGMHEVIHGRYGTARKGKIDGIEYGAKTGTAEFGPKADKTYRAWMMAFVPYENPKYAISILIEKSEGSATAAVPRMQALIKGLFRDVLPKEYEDGEELQP